MLKAAVLAQYGWALQYASKVLEKDKDRRRVLIAQKDRGNDDNIVRQGTQQRTNDNHTRSKVKPDVKKEVAHSNLFRLSTLISSPVETIPVFIGVR